MIHIPLHIQGANKLDPSKEHAMTSRAWWKVRGKQAFNPEFVRFADAFIEQVPTSDYWNMSDNW
jgi:hypothetical protein